MRGASYASTYSAWRTPSSCSAITPWGFVGADAPIARYGDGSPAVRNAAFFYAGASIELRKDTSIARAEREARATELERQAIATSTS